jgi:hypothetical protein
MTLAGEQLSRVAAMRPGTSLATCCLLLSLALASCAHAPRRGSVQAAIAGTVLDAHGPAAGVTVLLTRAIPGETSSDTPCPDPTAPWKALACPSGPGPRAVLQDALAQRRAAVQVATATTGANGQFAFEGLLPGAYVVWAHRETREVAVGFLPVLDGAETIRLGLHAGLVVENTVVSETGAPLPGVDVVAVHDWHTRYFHTRTDATGRFRFEALPDGDYTFVLGAQGRVPLAIDVNDAFATNRPLVLSEPRTLRGRVLREGQPVKGARVYVDGVAAAQTRTGENGAFALEELGPGRYRLAAEAAGASGEMEVGWEPGAHPAAVTLELAPGASVSGTVRDSRGQPIEGARVQTSLGTGLPWAFVTQRDGRFETPTVPLGFRTLTVDAPGRVHLARSVDVRPGGTRLNVTLPDGYPVNVTLQDASGEPLPPLPVGLRTPTGGEPLHRADLDATGTARFRVSKRGTARLTVSLSGWLLEADPESPRKTERSFELQVPTERQTLVLRDIPTQLLEGTVTTDQGVPLPGLHVRLLPREERGWAVRTTYTDATGRYSLKHVAPGAYVLELLRREYGSLRRWAQPVDVTQAPRQRLDIAMPRGAPLELVLVDPRGAPLVGAYVSLEEPAEFLHGAPTMAHWYSFDGPLEGAYSDHEGRVVFRDLPLAEYVVDVDPDFYTDSPRREEPVVRVDGGTDRVRVERRLVRVEVTRDTLKTRD